MPPPKEIGRQEAANEIARARQLIGIGNIAAARLVLRHLVDADVPEAMSLLASTYDAAMLRKWGVIGIKADQELADRLYRAAADRKSKSPLLATGR